MKKSEQSIVFPRRIGRLGLLCRYVVVLFPLTFISAVLKGIVHATLHKPSTRTLKTLTWEVVLLVLLVSLMYYVVRYTILPRIHDIGAHGALTILLFVPIVNVAFLLLLLCLPPNVFGERGGLRQATPVD